MKKIYLFIYSLIFSLNLFAQNGFLNGSEGHSVMTCNNGAVFGWGLNDYGQLGLDVNNQPHGGSFYVNPVKVYGLPEILRIQASAGHHTLAISCTGQVYAWGANENGQLGTGTTSTFNATPGLVSGGVTNQPTLSGVTDIAGGNSTSFALLQDGRVVSWGANEYGQLGNGTITSSLTPVYVMTEAGQPLQNVIKISAGENHAFALVDQGDGTGIVYSWGSNYNSDGAVLGRPNMTTNSFARPVQKQGGSFLNNIVSIAAGYLHVLALDANGQVWAWGHDFAGQIGEGDNYFIGDFATRVIAGEFGATTADFLGGESNPVVSIAAGQTHSAAVLADGSLATWGSNQYYIAPDPVPAGQLGICNSSTTMISSPVKAKTTPTQNLTNALSVSAGSAWTYVFTLDGKIYAAGYNQQGQLGIGSTTNQFCFVELQLPDCQSASLCPSLDLGADIVEVCPGFSKDIQVGIVEPGFSVDVYLNNELIETVQVATRVDFNYTVSELGNYRIVITDNRLSENRPCGPCSTSEDQVTFAAYPLPFNPLENQIYCGNTATFAVSEVGQYNWYNVAVGGTPLNETPTENSFFVDISQAQELEPNKSYALYAEDATTFQGSVIPVNPCNSTSSSQLIDGYRTPMMFTANKDFQLLSVDIVQRYYFSTGTRNFVVELLSNNPNAYWSGNGYMDGPGNVIATSTPVALANTIEPVVYTIPINFPIQGDASGIIYWLRLKQGSEVVYLDCPGTFPYEDNSGNNAMVINKSLFDINPSTAVGTMFNWKIQSESDPYICGRVPVVVTKDCPCQVPSDLTITPSENQVLCEGDNLTLSASMTLQDLIEGEYYYSWYKEDALLLGPQLTFENYMITNASTTDGGGSYSIRVEHRVAGDHSCFNADTVEVSVVSGIAGECTVTGTGKSKGTEFLVYPNPFTTYMHVEAENVLKIKLINLQGMVVAEFETVDFHIPDGLEAGIYTLEIKTADAVQYRKVIKSEK